jgi:predicted ATPase
MWLFWPHFKRIWAGAGAFSVGLAVNYVFAVVGKQSVPNLRDLSSLLYGYRYLTGGVLMLFAVASVFAKRAHRRHEAPHFIGEMRGRRGAKLPPLRGSKNVAATLIVGREGELARMRDWFASVLKSERRVVFVSGEAGIGKTTFVNTFVDSLQPEGLLLARGQCVEQYGAGEPYMPMLEALTQLGRGPRGRHLLGLLHRLAPAWLAQLPALLTADERARIQRETQGLTHQRMLREMAETLAAIAADTPLVLLLEDLHWSDASTLDLVAAIARRTEPARLLILGTYRPVEMLAGDHPLRALKQELELHQQCEELRLKLLSEKEVATYLSRRLANDGNQYIGLAPAIYQRTDGNALFMANMVDFLVAQGPELDASKLETPRNIRQMIERNLERLTAEEQSVLEVASVAGAEFSAAAAAAALRREVSEVEVCCTRLSRNEQFIRSQGLSEWPDGTVASHVRFLHALYREVLYERVPPGHRIELHRRIAAREETAYGEQSGEIATELADHYSRANDKNKAAKYFQLAGERAVGRCAMLEAEYHFARALELLSALPANLERDRRELVLQLAAGPALLAVKGFAAPETEHAYTRARELCAQLGDPTEDLFSALYGLWGTHLLRGELRRSYELAEQLLRRAETAHDAGLLIYARYTLGSTSYFMGETPLARKHIELAFPLYDPERHRPLALRYEGADAGIACLCYAALILWELGYPDQALKRGNEALTLAYGLSHPYPLSRVWAKFFVSLVHQFRQETRAAQQTAETVITLSTDHGLAAWLAWATALRGSAIAEHGHFEEGIAQLKEGLAASRLMGTELVRPLFLGLLAKACLEAGHLEDASQALTEALSAADQNDIRFYEAETHRVKGVLLLRQDESNTAEAQRCFERAIEVAHNQGARSLELRATKNLARLLDQEGHREEARTILAAIYNWFTEGFDTADLKDAKALLEELSRP